MKAYKGFQPDLTCRGFQYAEGQTYEHDGPVAACSSGFHACEAPIDVLTYYPPATSVFHVVELDGDLSRDGGDSKVAARKLTVGAQIGIPGLVKAQIEYVTERAKPVKGGHSAGDRGAASATGYSGAASATGTRGAASATGTSGAASATGTSGAASATGTSGAASATGTSGAASATGYSGAASATGYSGAASATGYSGAASATGTSGAASATGTSGAASATGTSGAAIATGWYGTAKVEGEHSVAVAAGGLGSAAGAASCVLFLIERNDDGEIIGHASVQVGDDGIEPGVAYALRDGSVVRV
jgi:hypothetical protein